LNAAVTPAQPHLIYASSSSVYGMNTRMPFSVHDNVDHPVSLYAATKKANELMAHTYSHLYGLPTTGLRFFTVYGPWGRPDMALFLFTRAILAGEPIKVFNEGRMQRDFTYIDDIVEGIVRLLGKPATPNPTGPPMRRTRAAAARPTACSISATTSRWQLLDFIAAIEDALGMRAEKGAAADAARRRARHLCRYRRALGLRGLPARHADKRRHRRFCGLVPRLLRTLSVASRSSPPFTSLGGH
jgi:nucleoside-diphosphate-sugar epimerase